VSTLKGYFFKKHPLLDRRQQQDKAAEDETGKISAYLDLADKAFPMDERDDSDEVA
jgi:hypothetical protein